MAHRDKSQGFGFVYVDIAKLLAEKDQLEKVHEAAPVDVKGVTQANFNKDKAAAPKLEVVPTEVLSDRAAAISQIKSNLDRLQSLHHRLHAMLEELNQINDRKKK